MTTKKAASYDELASRVSDVSDTIYILARELEDYWKTNSVPGTKPLRVCNIAWNTLKNMAYTLETIADDMLGN